MINRKPLLALLVLGPIVAGCSGWHDVSDDLLSRDADWFSRSGRLFIRNISIETPPLTPDKPVTAEDLVSADGGCPGMAPPPARRTRTRWPTVRPRPQPSTTGTVALGHTECDVVRGIGAPDNVNLSNNAARRPGGGRHLFARPACRHLHLHRRTPDVDRARPRAWPQPKRPEGEEEAGGASESVSSVSKGALAP